MATRPATQAGPSPELGAQSWSPTRGGKDPVAWAITLCFPESTLVARESKELEASIKPRTLLWDVVVFVRFAHHQGKNYSGEYIKRIQMAFIPRNHSHGLPWQKGSNHRHPHSASLTGAGTMSDYCMGTVPSQNTQWGRPVPCFPKENEAKRIETCYYPSRTLIKNAERGFILWNAWDQKCSNISVFFPPGTLMPRGGCCRRLRLFEECIKHNEIFWAWKPKPVTQKSVIFFFQDLF